MSIWAFLGNELTRNYWLENDKARFAERRRRVYSFMKIPRELEKFLLYGFFQCLDAFLFFFTLLPLRFLKSILKFFFSLFIRSGMKKEKGHFDSAEICDLLKVIILVLCCSLLNLVDLSMMYHIIRGQTVIKLYIFFNMLDVADKLCSSFGQDILDSLFWTATEPKGRKRDHVGLLPHLLLAVVYVFCHTLLVLIQANTLNVAFNSHNKALLTIMISNNFVELKGCVFKKFEKNNLFQMSCSDVRERIHLLLLLFVVAIRNLNQFSWNLDYLMLLLPDMTLVMVCEVVIDNIKHAFITKFNDISSEVYKEYNLSIAYDIASSRHSTQAFSDHVDVVSRRMGFIPLPLAALIFKVVSSGFCVEDHFQILLLFLFFLCLLTTKILISIILLGYAQTIIKSYQGRTNRQKQEEKNIPRLFNVNQNKTFIKSPFDQKEEKDKKEETHNEELRPLSKDDSDIDKIGLEEENRKKREEKWIRSVSLAEMKKERETEQRNKSRIERLLEHKLNNLSIDENTNEDNKNFNENKNFKKENEFQISSNKKSDLNLPLKNEAIEKPKPRNCYPLTSPVNLMYNSDVDLTSLPDLTSISPTKKNHIEEKNSNFNNSCKNIDIKTSVDIDKKKIDEYLMLDEEKFEFKEGSLEEDMDKTLVDDSHKSIEKCGLKKNSEDGAIKIEIKKKNEVHIRNLLKNKQITMKHCIEQTKDSKTNITKLKEKKKTILEKEKEKKPNNVNLKNIDRYTMCSNRII